MSSPQTEGAVIQFRASAQGGSGSYEYRFWEYGPQTNGDWEIVQDFSSSDSFSWNTTGKAGDSIIAVWVRNAGSAIDSPPITQKGLQFIVLPVPSSGTQPEPNSVTLVASPKSPQITGTGVVFTASASGGSGDYEYRFWEYGPQTNGQWIIAQDFSSNNTFNWDTSGKTGDNTIAVWARNTGSSMEDNNSIAKKGFNFIVQSNQPPATSEPSWVTISSNQTSPQPVGDIVRFTADAGGGGGNYEYRFWEYGPGTNYQWVVVRDFATSTSFDWNTSGKRGVSEIAVWARNVGSNLENNQTIAKRGLEFSVY
jgi:hypothetical protein